MIRSLAAVAVLSAGGLAVAVSPPPAAPRWIWNATASAPEGLYALHADPSWRRHDLVAVRPLAPLAIWLDQRGYAPTGVLLIKQVAAVAPSRVCRAGALVSIDDAVVAHAQARDRAGRPLPTWSGCRVLTDDDVFLLNPAQGLARQPLSRAFGPRNHRRSRHAALADHERAPCRLMCFFRLLLCSIEH